MAMNLAMIWAQDISRFKMKSDKKKERKGESEMKIENQKEEEAL